MLPRSSGTRPIPQSSVTLVDTAIIVCHNSIIARWIIHAGCNICVHLRERKEWSEMVTPATGDQDSAGSDPNADGAQGEDEGSKFFVAKYKSREDADRGIQEKDATISRLQSERDKAKSEGNKLTEVLERLTAVQERTTRGNPEKDQTDRVDAMIDELADAWKEDESKGARKTLELISAYAEDIRGASAKDAEKLKAELVADLDKRMSTIQQTLAQRDPEYVAHKVAIESWAEKLGIDPNESSSRNLLLKLAKETAKTEYPERHQLPGGVGGGGRSVGGEDSGVDTDRLNALLGKIGHGKISDKERAALKG